MKAPLYILGGVLVGFGAGWVALEGRLTKKYDEMAEANQRAYQRASMMTPQVVDVEELDINEFAFKAEVPPAGGIQIFDPKERAQSLAIKTDYHAAFEVPETPTEMFVSGGVNDYGVSYIEEEEFEDEDGRAKFQVDLILDGQNPCFLLDGTPMDDWDQKLGDSILVDMFTKCPPGIPAVLYVRNHATDEDYEVVRVEP